MSGLSYSVAISVQFDPATYSVNEGGSVEITIVLSSASESEVTVVFTTRDGSAVGK